MNSAQNTVHQRTQLFGSKFDKPVETASSAYNDSSIDYSQSVLAQLESQSDFHVGVIRHKVDALKNLSLRMNEEIRRGNTLGELSQTFDQTQTKLRTTFKKMTLMSKNSQVSIKTWISIFLIVTILFVYVWVF